MLIVGLVAVAAGVTALTRYGILADLQVAMVVEPGQLHSIPSDASDTQKNVPLAPRTIVVIERSFLDRWDQVRTRGETTGWVRREALVPFYLPPPESPVTP